MKRPWPAKIKKENHHLQRSIRWKPLLATIKKKEMLSGKIMKKSHCPQRSRRKPLPAKVTKKKPLPTKIKKESHYLPRLHRKSHCPQRSRRKVTACKDHKGKAITCKDQGTKATAFKDQEEKLQPMRIKMEKPPLSKIKQSDPLPSSRKLGPLPASQKNDLQSAWTWVGVKVYTADGSDVSRQMKLAFSSFVPMSGGFWSKQLLLLMILVCMSSTFKQKTQIYMYLRKMPFLECNKKN